MRTKIQVEKTLHNMGSLLGTIVNLESEEEGWGAAKYRTYSESDAAAAKLSLLISSWCESSHFCIGDNRKFGQDLTKILTVGNVHCGALNNINLEMLISQSKPAPFGDLKQKKTVIDPNVRSALECEPFDIHHFNYTISYSISAIQKTMLNDDFDVELVPYKINIYGPGDSFKSHTDTPKFHNMIGTAVFCLPYKHEGGALVIRQMGMEKTFDFSVHSHDAKILQWAAFFGDCEHEVLPVISGYRITATYSIVVGKYKHDFSDNSRFKSSDEESETERETKMLKLDVANSKIYKTPSNLCSLLQTAANDSDFLGIILHHRYTMVTVSPEFLKGIDLQIYKSLLNEYEETALCITPIVIHTNYENYDDMDAGGDFTNSYTVKVYDLITSKKNTREALYHQYYHRRIPFKRSPLSSILSPTNSFCFTMAQENATEYFLRERRSIGRLYRK